MAMVISDRALSPWLLLVFRLPAKKASQRVEIWRKLKRYGALALRSSGYLLPNTAENRERFEWLATALRRYKGEASVLEVHAIDDLPSSRLQQMFVEARSRDYQSLVRELKKYQAAPRPRPAVLTRLRRRFQETAAIDFFTSPLRSRVEALLLGADGEVPRAGTQARRRKEYTERVWITRPRPGIDRVASAWLIQRSIDAKARFVFGDDPQRQPGAVPFDMFQGGGFGHRGEDCTFETLRREFVIRDAKVATLAQIIHDADLGDEKFGRTEGVGLDRVLIGWAQEGVPDDELLRRGMELIEGLYQSLA